MKTKKKTLRRLMVLYVLFFAVIAVSLFMSFSPGSFNEGFAVGKHDAQAMMEGRKDGRKVNILYDLRVSGNSMDFRTQAYDSPDNSLKIKVRPATIDLQATSTAGDVLSNNHIVLLFTLLAMLCYAAIFVVIFLIINSLRRSIRTGDLFDKGNIALTRSIGILLIVGSLLMSFAVWIESRMAAPFLEGTPYDINTSFPFDFTAIIMGVLIFVVAEVFVMGYSLREEQKLTI